MKTQVTPRILSGFMELLPGEQIAFNKMTAIIQNAYESAGFIPLDTPVLELSEILLAKAGGETEKQIYRFSKGDTDMCLRFDLTVPLSRFVAQHQNALAFPFRRYQIAKSYRGERPQKGRFREFYQADIDIVGSGSLPVLYDAEIPSIIYRIFKQLGLERFHIHINNRKILKGFYEALGLSEQAPDILRLIDKAEKIGIENVRLGLIDLGIEAEKIINILDFIKTSGSVEQVLAQLRALPIQNELFSAGYEELKQVCFTLMEMNVPESHFMIDLKITRGLDYYTGTVYETFADDFPGWGSICSGGRYDHLAQHYTDRHMPGVGMSIGLTRLFDLLRAQGLLSVHEQTTAEVLVLPMGSDVMGYAVQVMTALKEADVRTQIYFGDTKFKNKMTYANKIGVPFAAIVGEEEREKKHIAFKNMSTGEQELLTVSEVVRQVMHDRKERQDRPIIHLVK